MRNAPVLEFTLLLSMTISLGCGSRDRGVEPASGSDAGLRDSGVADRADGAQTDARAIGPRAPRDVPTLWTSQSETSFGRSVALTADGLTIAVGQQSSVYTFSRPDTAAGFPTSPSGSPTTPDGSHNFGASVAFGELDGTSLFVGDDQLSPGGGFHRFVRAGADFGVARETKLGLADLFGRQRYQHLGASLATFTDQDGGLLVAVGDPGFDTNITEGEPTTRHGGVRAFGLTEDGTWQRRPRFGSEGSPLSDDYGLSLSAIGYLTTVPHQVFAVGDRRDNGYAVRTVSYHRSDRGTEPLGELPENASADFASSVALSQDALLLVVGDQGTWDIGELTIWSRASRSVDFVYQRTIEAPAGAFSFGRSLALRRDGTELFVGAISPAGEGAVYQVFLE